jgi:hypothetical protein
MSDTMFEQLENAMKPIVDEMFKNGWEEGNRIWDDASHPLHRALQNVLEAHANNPTVQKEAAALLEQHRRMEEDGTSVP